MNIFRTVFAIVIVSGRLFRVHKFLERTRFPYESLRVEERWVTRVDQSGLWHAAKSGISIKSEDFTSCALGTMHARPKTGIRLPLKSPRVVWCTHFFILWLKAGNSLSATWMRD